MKGNPGRSECCEQCRNDLKVCLNCVFYDPGVAHQCKERRADPVAEKNTANFCEYFEFARRVYAGGAQASSRESAARDALKKLFGD
jgi:hypothetical protein